MLDAIYKSHEEMSEVIYFICCVDDGGSGTFIGVVVGIIGAVIVAVVLILVIIILVR